MAWKMHPLTLMNILTRSLCLTRLMSEPAALQSKLTGVMMCKHMDDGVLVGPDEAQLRTEL